MKANPACFFAGVLLLAANDRVYPQYAPPPAPFRGFLNEALRANNPYLSQWDIGGSARVRFEARQGFGIPGIAGSLDFREHGVDVDNEYFLERIRYRVGDADKWWSALVEGRTSFAQGDQRFACPNTPPAPGSSAYNGLGPESDTLDLHQAYLTSKSAMAISSSANMSPAACPQPLTARETQTTSMCRLASISERFPGHSK